jgi:hypothetical protein
MAGGRCTHPRLQRPSASPVAPPPGDWSCRLQHQDNSDASCVVHFSVKAPPTPAQVASMMPSNGMQWRCEGFRTESASPAEAERASDLALRLRRAEDGPEICSRLSRRLAGCSPSTARFAVASLTPLLASRLL